MFLQETPTEREWYNGTMKREDAKRYYQEYRGSSFFMAHDDLRLYREFQDLSVSDDEKTGWLRELAQDLLDSYDVRDPAGWRKISDLSIVLSNKLCPKEEYLRRLLSLLKAGVSDPHHKVIVLEDFIGRTAERKDGLLYLMEQHCPLLLPEAEEVLHELASSFTEEERKDERIAKAVRSLI